MNRTHETSAYAHIFLNGEEYGRRPLDHVPRVGDTVRMKEAVYAKVTEVVWVLDEPDSPLQRVNLRLEMEKP